MSVFERLFEKLVTRQKVVSERLGWLDGSTLINPKSSSQDSAFTRFESISKTNLLPVIANIYSNRLRITSIVDKTIMSPDVGTWQVFEKARARKDFTDAVHDALSLGWGYVLVLPHRRKNGQVTTRSFSPLYAVTLPYSDDPTESKYGLVLSRDEAGIIARLYDESSVWTYRAKNDQEKLDKLSATSFEFESEAQHKLGRVPLVELGDGKSVLENGVKAQSLMWQSSLHAIAVERSQSFSKIIIAGYDLEENEDGSLKDPGLNGNPASISYLKRNDDASTASIWQSTPTGTSDLTSRELHAAYKVAASCEVPAHYVVTGSSASVSPDVMAANESVFLAKLGGLADSLGEQIDYGIELLRSCAGLDAGWYSVGWSLHLQSSLSTAGDNIIKLVSSGMSLDSAISQVGLASPYEAKRIAERQEAGDLLDKALQAAAEEELKHDDSAGGDGE